MATEISQKLVNCFRMDRHFLNKRALKKDLEVVVERVCGIQAQMPAAANMQLWARVEDLNPEDVTTALWANRTIFRTWCMRGTAHYLPTTQFPAYLKAIIEPRIPRHKEWLAKRGMREFGEIAKMDPSQHDFEAILSAVTNALSDGPATREKVAQSVADEVGPEARPWVDTGYYIVTKLLAYEGKVCFGPDMDGNVSLVLIDQWLPKQPRIEKEAAEDLILSSYLRSYGPATPQDFSAWSGLKMAIVKTIWERNHGHLSEVTLNGNSLWILEQDLKTLLNPQNDSSPVRLLPHFDIFLLGHKNKSHIVDDSHYKQVFKKAAWIAPILLHNGQAIGVWSQKRTTKKLVVTIEPFITPLNKSQIHDIEAESQRLGDYFELTPEVQMKP